MRHVGCFWVLALVSVVQAGTDHVFLTTWHNAQQRDGLTFDTSQNLQHPSQLSTVAEEVFGSVVVNAERGHLRVSAQSRSDGAWWSSIARGTATNVETIVVEVDCDPQLIGAQGTLRLRPPVVVLTGGTYRPTGTGFNAPSAGCSVQISVNGTEIYNRGVWYAWDQPPAFSGSTGIADAQFTIGQPITITVRAQAQGVGAYSEPVLSYGFATAEVALQGIESIFGPTGSLVPCEPTCQGGFGCDAFVPPPTCPGDANNDGMTDAADLSVLLSTFGTQTAPYYSANFNGDAFVNGADLSILLSNFGCSLAP